MHKFFVRLAACFIFNKTTRQRFRHKYMNMPLFRIFKNNTVINHGKNNRFVLHMDDGTIIKNPTIDGLCIEFFGDNNVCELYAPLPKFINCKIQMANDAHFVLQESRYKLKNFIVWRMKKGTECTIGKNFSCEGVEIALHGEENLKVSIGENCMFSHDIFIQPTDNHSIIDKKTKKPINFGKSIVIGDHVWVCPYVHIHKGAIIPHDCVIGTCSIITKPIEKSNCVVVGTPPKIIKRNITWSRNSTADYLKWGY